MITPITNIHTDLTAVCNFCQSKHHLRVDTLEYVLWEGGSLVQKCFPDLTADEREVIIAQRTGVFVCNPCWNEELNSQENL